SGRHQGPASKPTTENPISASRHASVPPPAPVPTIAKSTASSSRYSRIGTQPPTRNGSGARPFLPRGRRRASSNASIVSPGLTLAFGLGRSGLPWVAAIEIHSDIAAGTCRTTKADLVPRGRMRVIGRDDIGQQTLREKDGRLHVAPVDARAGALLDRAQYGVL